MTRHLMPDGSEVFGTREYVRADKTCSWCGQNKENPGGKKYLIKYHVESPNGRKFPVSGEFCSFGCMKSYHH